MSELPPLDGLSDDERFMVEALREAWRAFHKEEVPVGAVVVHQGTIIGRGHNQVEMLQDATAHAEILAIGAASESMGGWRLEGCTLYSTLEPCCMCAGACFLSRVDRIVWGAPDVRHGANGSFIDLFSLSHPTHKIDVTPHLLKQWCVRPIQLFFKKKRED